ncbi:MAG: hypothetical protein H0U76_26015, partial [Ktedonobacteraceae bacterium]|nr:hypothetical protein [Ktedonobacteraceae bacterium]
TNTYPSDITTSPLAFLYFLGSGYGPGYGLGTGSATAFVIGNWRVAPWLGFTLLSLFITLLLVLLCLWTIKPRVLYFAASNQTSDRDKSADVAA